MTFRPPPLKIGPFAPMQREQREILMTVRRSQWSPPTDRSPLVSEVLIGQHHTFMPLIGQTFPHTFSNQESIFQQNEMASFVYFI